MSEDKQISEEYAAIFAKANADAWDNAFKLFSVIRPQISPEKELEDKRCK